MNEDLPIIQRTYDLIKWYIPLIERMPKSHRFTLGDRIANGLYDLLEGLLRARYAGRDRLSRLEALNSHLDVLRYQTRILHDFELIDTRRYEFAGKALYEIGASLGGWIKEAKGR